MRPTWPQNGQPSGWTGVTGPIGGITGASHCGHASVPVAMREVRTRPPLLLDARTLVRRGGEDGLGAVEAALKCHAGESRSAGGARARGVTSAGVGAPSSVRPSSISACRISSTRRGARLAAAGQAPEERAADEDGAGAEGQRDEDVGAAADAAVHEDLDPVADRLDDLGQHVERGRDAVELAAAVVGDDDAGGAVLGGEPRVLGGVDALHDHRQRATRRRGARARATSATCRRARRTRAAWGTSGAPQRRADRRHVDASGTAKPVRMSRSRRPGPRRVDGQHDRVEAALDAPRPSAPGVTPRSRRT